MDGPFAKIDEAVRLACQAETALQKARFFWRAPKRRLDRDRHLQYALDAIDEARKIVESEKSKTSEVAVTTTPA